MKAGDSRSLIPEMGVAPQNSRPIFTRAARPEIATTEHLRYSYLFLNATTKEIIYIQKSHQFMWQLALQKQVTSERDNGFI